MKLPSTVCAHEILLNGTNHQFNWVSNRNLSHYVCRNETMQGNLIHWKTVWTICGAHCVDFGVGSSVRAKKRKKLINCCLLSHSPLKSEQLDQISEQILQEQLWNLERFSRVLTFFFYPVRLIINCTPPSAFWVKSLKWCREYTCWRWKQKIPIIHLYFLRRNLDLHLPFNIVLFCMAYSNKQIKCITNRDVSWSLGVVSFHLSFSIFLIIVHKF